MLKEQIESAAKRNNNLIFAEEKVMRQKQTTKKPDNTIVITLIGEPSTNTGATKKKPTHTLTTAPTSGSLHISFSQTSSIHSMEKEREKVLRQP